MATPPQPGPPKKQSSTRSSLATTPRQTPLTSRSLVLHSRRPGLARRPHYKTGTSSLPMRTILNKPNEILESILLNLPLGDLIIGMHVSKTWLHVACRSERIRNRLFWWHVNHIIDSRPGTPNSDAARNCELFPRNLEEGVLITYNHPRKGEYFVLLKNRCENRAIRLLDNTLTTIDLDWRKGKFYVNWYDHAGEPAMRKVFAPYKIGWRAKMPILVGDRMFDYFKTFHSPAGMDWGAVLEWRMSRAPLARVRRLVGTISQSFILIIPEGTA